MVGGGPDRPAMSKKEKWGCPWAGRPPLANGCCAPTVQVSPAALVAVLLVDPAAGPAAGPGSRTAGRAVGLGTSPFAQISVTVKRPDPIFVSVKLCAGLVTPHNLPAEALVPGAPLPVPKTLPGRRTMPLPHSSPAHASSAPRRSTTTFHGHLSQARALQRSRQVARVRRVFAGHDPEDHRVRPYPVRSPGLPLARRRRRSGCTAGGILHTQFWLAGPGNRHDVTFGLKSPAGSMAGLNNPDLGAGLRRLTAGAHAAPTPAGPATPGPGSSRRGSGSSPPGR